MAKAAACGMRALSSELDRIGAGIGTIDGFDSGICVPVRRLEING
jgi:hypothetical protein